MQSGAGSADQGALQSEIPGGPLLLVNIRTPSTASPNGDTVARLKLLPPKDFLGVGSFYSEDIEVIEVIAVGPHSPRPGDGIQSTHEQAWQLRLKGDLQWWARRIPGES